MSIYIYIFVFLNIRKKSTNIPPVCRHYAPLPYVAHRIPTFSPARMGDKFEMRSSRDGSDEMITHCEAVGKSCTKDLRKVSQKGAGVKAID